jgi:hypothetical protein
MVLVQMMTSIKQHTSYKRVESFKQKMPNQLNMPYLLLQLGKIYTQHIYSKTTSFHLEFRWDWSSSGLTIQCMGFG